MPKTYVDVDELEQLFIENAVPYTNIFDEIRQVLADEIIQEMSALDLKQALEAKKDVIAVQVWTEEDIQATLRIKGIEGDAYMISKIAEEAKVQLGNCTENWNRLSEITKKYVESEGIS